MPQLGVRVQTMKPMRQRAETVDIQQPPQGDAIPFGKSPSSGESGQRSPAATVDFRDLVTPGAPQLPWMLQEQTLGVGQRAGTDDFRHGLTSDNQPRLPAPDQDDTASDVNLGATVEAARQVSAVVGWTVERWARLCVALERHPHNAEGLWLEQGITSTEAREHASRQWQRRLDKEPSTKAEMIGYIERFRALR